MAKATQAFHVWDDELARSVVFNPGDEVPDHIARTVGEHVLDKPVKADSSAVDDGENPFAGEAFDAAVQAHVDAQLEAAREEGATSQREREQAAVDAIDADNPFDVEGDGVNASHVKNYLEGLDRDTVAGAAEYDRVVAAEQAGPNRSTAIPKSD